MNAIGSWFLRVLFTVLGALAGLIVIGLPGFRTVPTIDGSPVVGGYIPPEQVSTIIREGKAIGSYIDFYGLALPGQPLYWTIAIIAGLAFAGYRIGSLFRVSRVG